MRASCRARWASTGLPPGEFDAFTIRVRNQLREHGAIADLPYGESFHLMTDI